MNIRQAYIETKSAKKINEITPPTGFINIQSVNSTIQVRDKSSTEDWTTVGSYLMTDTYYGTLKLPSIVSSANKSIYYVSSYVTDVNTTKYLIFVSEAPFDVTVTNWNASITWHVTGTLYSGTRLYIGYTNMTSFWHWANPQDKTTPKDYGQGTPETFYSQIASDYLGG